jgi:HK97 family phage major capsid protein
MNIEALKRELTRIKNEMREITAEARKRETQRLTEEDRDRWEKLKAEADIVERDIKIAEEEREVQKYFSEDDDRDQRTDPKELAFSSFGDFLGAVIRSSQPGGSMDPRFEKRAASGMSTGVPSDGGFLVGTDIMSEIFKLTYDRALVANRCRKVQVGSNSNGIAMNAIDETSRATGSRMGGIRGYWKAEADKATATTPKFKKIKMDLEKLMTFVYLTEETLTDTTALDSMVGDMVADEFAWLLDDAIINGLGSGLPLGIMNSDAMVSVAKEGSQSDDTITYPNVLKMWGRMWARSRPNSVWYINQDCEQQLHQMSLVVSDGGAPVYLPAGGASVQPFSTLFGRPVIPVEQCQTVGDNGDILLSDMSQYMLIEKGGVNRDASMHVRFLYDEQLLRFTYRVNGQPLWNSALTPANGSNTLSPFVSLATR